MNSTVLYILIIIAVVALFPVIEHAATSPGTLTQLATSSTNTLPYGYSPWWTPGPCMQRVGGCGSGVCGGQGRPAWQFHNTRPVMQRGVYFGNPQFHRA